MTTETFIKQLNSSITIEGHTLMVEFFIIFSRFECALKVSNFTNGNLNNVSANWDAFIATISNTFNKEKSSQLTEAVDYIIQHPPRIQILNNEQLEWRGRVFQINDREIQKLNLSIRDIRNNLFHGGKFSGNYQEDVSRNFVLLKSSIIILNEWLSLNKQVRINFLQSIF